MKCFDMVGAAYCTPQFRQKAVIVLVIGAVFSFAQSAMGQGQQVRGVKHQVNLSIKVDPDSRPLPSENAKTTLSVEVLISDFAQGSSFYGVVRGTISDFDPIKGSAEQKIWSDLKCHPERGTPKITALNVDGTTTEGSTKNFILSRFRKLGLLIPADEVTPARSLPGGVDATGPFTAMRAVTKKSHLFLDLKLYTLPCNL